MKVLRYVAITLMLGSVFIPSYLIGEKRLESRIVLRLAYRGQVKNYLSKPYTIGMFEFGEHRIFYSGDLMGTDWNGNIYIFDPIAPDLYVLKRFDRKEVFKEAWEPIRARRGHGVGVTKDGYIWTGLGWVVADRPNGWPVVVYRSGIKKPVMDWRYKLPKAIEDKVYNFLKKSGFEWKKWEELPHYDYATNDWYFLQRGPEYSQNKVALKLRSPFLGDVNRIARKIWLLISSNGKQIFEMRLTVEGSPYLSPDGTVWVRESDFNTREWKWSKVWWRKASEERGEPLIDRTKEPWKSITERMFFGPSIQMDAVGNIYVFFERRPAKPREQRIIVGGEVITFPPSTLGGELALVVLNSKRQLLVHLPWQLAFSAVQTAPFNWIAPLPDGSGFYRMEYREREAVIYFHPLPK